MTTQEILRKELHIRLIKLINPVLMTGLFFGLWYHYVALTLNDSALIVSIKTGFILAIFFFIYCVMSRLYDAFLISLMRISEVVYGQVISLAIADVIMSVISYLMYEKFFPITTLLWFFFLQSVASTSWAYFSHRWYFRKYPPQSTVIIWDMRQDMDELLHRYGMSMKFNVIANTSVTDCINGNMQILNGSESVFLCGIHSHERNQILKYCLANSITVYVIPRIGDVLMSGARPLHLFRLPMLRLNRHVPNPEYLIAKRVFDIIFSCFALTLSLPITLIIAVCIKCQDGGPIFYRQTRLTKDRKTFRIIKFRSMYLNAEESGHAELSSGHDDKRVTPIGRFIRRFRIDEIPQFLNVLHGDMSLVGPRPERPELFAEIEKDVPDFALRLQVKAGITGYAQVYGKYKTTPYDKLLMDLMYIAKPSLSTDFIILLATVKALFLPDLTE